IVDDGATEDAAYSWSVPSAAFDDDDLIHGDSLSYTASTPSWLTFNTTTNTLSGTPVNAEVGDHTVIITATDEQDTSVTDTFVVTVANTNDAPTVSGVLTFADATEDSAYSMTLPVDLFDDVDVGDTLTITVSAPSWLGFNATTGVLSGTPLNANVGTETITVTATDTGGAAISVQADLTSINTNDLPTGAVVIDGQLREGYDLTANTGAVQDDDGLGTLGYQWYRSTNDGVDWSVITGATNSIYQLGVDDPGALIKVTVSYTDLRLTAETISAESATTVNYAPTAVDDAIVVQNGISTTLLNLLNNDSDLDGDSISITGKDSTSAQGGMVTYHEGGGLVYTPASGFIGTDSFGYTITDSEGDTSSATVTVDVDTPPESGVGAGDLYAVATNNQQLVTLGGTDAESDSLSFLITALPSNGTLYQTSDGTTLGDVIDAADTTVTDGQFRLIFVPDTDWNGTTTLEYKAHDGKLLSLDTATASITVTPNFAPVMTSDTASATWQVHALDPDPTGVAVQTLLTSGLVTDQDSDVMGIAVTGADVTNGYWEFSTDGGSSWNVLSDVSTSAATLLAEDAQVRFQADDTYAGSVTLSFQAWDQSDGLASGTENIDVSNGDAYSAFSSGSTTVTANVEVGLFGDQLAKLTASTGDVSDLLGSDVDISGSVIIAGAPDYDSTATAFGGSVSLVSQNKPVTASGYYGNMDYFHPSGITDGNLTDEYYAIWETNNGQTGWVTIDLGQEYLISQLKVMNSDNRHHGDRGTRDFRIEIWGESTSATTVVDNTLSDPRGLTTHPFYTYNVTPIAGQYVKFYVDSYYGSSAALNEIQAYGQSQVTVANLTGAVYLYEMDDSGSWSETEALVPSAAEAGDDIGQAVAVSGDVALISATGDDDQGSNAGAAYLYTKQTDGSWTQTTKLTASDGSAGESFGNALDVDGTTAVVGAVSANTTGAVYLFEKASETSWTESEIVAPSDLIASDQFGYAVALDGTRMIVSAPGQDGADDTPSAGAAYIFEQQENGSWSQVAKLVADVLINGDGLGYRVALSGGLAVLTTPSGDANGTDKGAAYVFERLSDGSWDQTAILADPDASGIGFGDDVAIKGNTIIVSDSRDDTGGADKGSIYFFEKGSSGWTYVATQQASDGVAADLFGGAIAVDGDQLVVGATGDDDNGSNSGSIYVHALNSAYNDTPILSGSMLVVAGSTNGSETILVSTLVDGLISDVDSPDVGIAVTGLNSGSGEGVWQYSIDGANWLSFNTISESSATLLDADDTTAIRFVAVDNDATDVSITVRAWDGSDGLDNGSTGVDIAGTGGTSPFSTATLTTSVNMVPDLTVSTNVAQSVMQFDGVDDYIAIPDSDSLDLTGSFSLEFWVNPDTLTGNQGLIAQDQLLSNNGAFVVWLDGANLKMALRNDGSQSTLVANTGASLSIGSWAHIAIVFDDSADTLTFYQNGVQLGDPVSYTDEVFDSTAPIVLGNRDTGAEYNVPLEGKLDTVRIWGDARTSDEIAESFQQEAPISNDNLLAHYDFESITGDQVLDRSGNANTATLGSDTVDDAAQPVALNNHLDQVVHFSPVIPVTNLSAIRFADSEFLKTSVTVTGSFSAETWFYREGQNLWDVLMSQSGDQNSFHVSYNASNQLVMNIQGETFTQDISSFDADNATMMDEWYHLAVTYDAPNNHGIVYLNGQEVINETHATSLVQTNTFYIGNDDWNSGGDGFNGLLDDFRLWDDVRTPEEVVAGYANSTPINPDNLILSYDFESASSGQILDQSGNGNHGILGSSTASDGADPKLFNYRPTVSNQYAMRIDSGDYINTNYTLTGADFTIESWFYRDETFDYDVLAASSGNTQFWVGFNPSQKIGLSLAGSHVYFDPTSSNPANPSLMDSWHHWALSYDASAKTGTFYLDGQSLFTNTHTNAISLNDNLLLGNDLWDSSDDNFQGLMDDVRVWSDVRTATEIADSYYQNTPTNIDNQVLSYDFETVSNGQVLDQSGNNQSGTLGASTAVDAADTVLTTLTGIEKPNLNQAVIATVMPSVQVDNMSLEGWFRWDGVDTGTNMNLLQVGTTLSNGYNLYAARQSSGVYHLSAGRPGVETLLTTDYALVADTWVHVALERDSGTWKIFADGVALSATGGNTTGAPTVPTGGFYIGNDSEQTVTFSGDIADVRFWSDIRTESELQSTMEQTLTGSEANLVGYWKLDEGSGSSVTDSAGSANGSLNGATSWTDSGQPDAPSISTNSVTLDEDATLVGTIEVVDSEGDAFTLSVQSDVTNGTLTLNTSTGGWSYLPDSEFSGTDSFTVRVSQGDFISDQQVNLTIQSVNDAPQLSGTLPTVIGSTAGTQTMLVADLISGLASDVETTDPGVAVTGLDNGTGGGVWQFTTNGTDWTDFSTISESAATLLSADSTTAVRFVSSGGSAGDASITVRAWDGSDGSANGTTDVAVDSTGERSPFSDTALTSSVNMAPVLTASTDYTQSVAQFDSVNDYITIPGSSDMVVNGDFTMEFWVNPDRLTGTTQAILSQDQFAISNGAFAVWINETGNFILTLRELGYGEALSYHSDANLTIGQWDHIAVAFDDAANTVTVYQNGIQVGTPASYTGDIFDSTADILIGNRDTGSDLNMPFDGQLDEVRIWGDVRSASEILSSYQTQLTGAEDNLLVHYDFNSVDNGVVTNSVVDGIDGQLGTAVVGDSAEPMMVNTLGGALRFDGNGDYVTLGSVSTVPTAFTVEAIVKLDQNTTLWSRFLELGNGPSSDNILFSLYENTGKAVLNVRIGSAVQGEVVSADVLPLNTWVHVTAVAYGDGSGRIYFDGVEQGYVSSGMNIRNIARSTNAIAHSSWTVDPDLDGDIAEVRLWGKALTQDEINSNLHAPLSGSESGLQHYWNMNEGSGTVVTDQAGSVDGTLVGGSTWIDTNVDLPMPEITQSETLFTAEDSPLTGTIQAVDDEGDSVRLSLQADAANGSVSFNATTGAWSYTPDANFNGTDSFTIRTTQNEPVGQDAVVVTEVLTADEVITLTVLPAQDAHSGSLTLSGTPSAGETLTVDSTAFVEPDGLGDFSYQWQRLEGVGDAGVWTDISGETTASYVAQNSDIGTMVRAVVDYVDDGGTVESVTSSPSSTVTVANLVGTSGADTLTATIYHSNISGLDGDDTLTGGTGNDTLDGGAGNDLLSAGAGDDTLIYDSADTTTIDGGAGSDTLQLTVDTASLHLTNVANSVLNGIEIIEMVGGNHALSFDALDVTSLSESTDQLFVTGSSTDTLSLLDTDNGSWNDDGIVEVDSVAWNKYSSGTATVLVDTDITATVDTLSPSLYFEQINPTFTDLRAHFALDGNATDSTGNGYDGVLSSVAVSTTTDRFGNAASAYTFTTADEYIDIPKTVADFDLNDFAISMWYKSGSHAAAGGALMVMDSSDPYTGPTVYFGYPGSNDTMQFRIDYDDAVNWTNQKVADSQWHHGVFQRAGNQLEIYVDGEQVATNTVSAINLDTTVYDSDFRLGAHAIDQSIQEYYGSLDELSFYTRALTANEISTTYSGQVQTGEDVTFLKGSGAVSLLQGVVLTNHAVTNWDGGVVTAAVSSNGTANDQLTINDQGTGAGQINISGSDLYYGSTAIGTFSGGVDGAALTVSLNSAASTDAVQALMHNIAFANDATTPSVLTRTVTVQATNNLGNAASVTQDVLIEVNTLPTASDNTITAIENTSQTIALSDLGFNDADGDALDHIEIISTIGSGTLRVGSTLINAGDSISLAEINSNSFTFTPDPGTSGNGYGAFAFKVHDGTALSTSANTINFNVDLVGASNLNARYTFDGTALDSSGNGHSGTFYSGITQVADRFGNANSAISFDGTTNGLVKLDHAAMNGLTDFTVSFWAKFTDTGSTKHFMSGATTSNFNAFLPIHDAGVIRMLFSGGSFTFGSDLNDGGWHALHFVRTGASIKFYADGSFQSEWTTASTSALTIAPNGLWLGGDQDSLGGGFATNQQYTGQMDEVRIYNRALSATEVANTVSMPMAADPIVFDLNGDGINLVSTEGLDNDFDMVPENAMRAKVWAGPDDGYLVMDKDGDGQINDITEMLSEFFTAGHDSGLSALSTLDDNGDQVINAGDGAFDSLMIWQDLDSDGVTDPGELKPLNAHGIESINLDAETVNFTVDGATVLSEGSFVYSSGVDGQFAELDIHIVGDAETGSSQVDITTDAVAPLAGLDVSTETLAQQVILVDEQSAAEAINLTNPLVDSVLLPTDIEALPMDNAVEPIDHTTLDIEEIFNGSDGLDVVLQTESEEYSSETLVLSDINTVDTEVNDVSIMVAETISLSALLPDEEWHPHVDV
ncbi:MAG: tandem-95 repeat protein, partial [Magnetococcales bacterium]|nr:tandem-95 repeat protein [Magnetococcales bacterium]